MSAEKYVDSKMQKPKYCTGCRTDLPAHYKPEMRCVMCIRFGSDRNARAYAEFAPIVRASRARD